MSLVARPRPAAAGGCRIAAVVTCEGCTASGGVSEWAGPAHELPAVNKAARDGAAERARLRGFLQMSDGRWLCSSCQAFEPVAAKGAP